MAGYIGSKTSVTQVDGYNRTEADAEFVNDPNSVISVSGSNVGIGTTLDVSRTGNGQIAVLQTSSNRGFSFESQSDTALQIASVQGSTNLDLWANTLTFSAGGSERMRIDSSGNLLVGTIVQFDGSNPARLCLQSPGTGGRVINSKINTSGSANHITFYNSIGQVGRITTSGLSTSYVTSSDYRLKTDAQPMTGASARVQALNPVNFEWIADGTRVDGFLAHEAQEVVPEAVTGAKDAMRDEEYEVTPAVLDDDGNVVTEAVMGTRSVPDYQGIDQSKLVPLLTAALQEALTEIADLKARVTALEAV